MTCLSAPGGVTKLIFSLARVQDYKLLDWPKLIFRTLGEIRTVTLSVLEQFRGSKPSVEIGQ